MKYKFTAHAPSSKRLIVTFSPHNAGGKYFLYKAHSVQEFDCLSILDENDLFYIQDIDSISTLLNDILSKHTYTSVVFTGFSAGAFAAVCLAQKTKGIKNSSVHAFSPHINVFNPFSAAWPIIKDLQLPNSLNLVDIINSTTSDTKFKIYFPLHSAKDSIHIEDSVNRIISNSEIHYLKYAHNTADLLKTEEYPKNLRKFFDNSDLIPHEILGGPLDLVDSILLADFYKSELAGVLSTNIPRKNSPSEFCSEFCYWYGRKLIRSGADIEAIQWINASILKSLPDVPDSYYETLGNLCFITGRLNEALSAYKKMTFKFDWTVERIQLLSNN